MFLRKRLSSLSAKSKKIISGVLVAVMVAGSVIAGTSLKAGAYSKTQDVLDELLGAAKPYGVVADEFIFPGSYELLVMADKLEEVKTICWCGKKAAFNARFDENGRVVKQGAHI